jgi:hypothetical protein
MSQPHPSALGYRTSVLDECSQILVCLFRRLSQFRALPLVNALFFDVYGDERSSYDQPVFVQGGYLQTLAGLVHRMRSLVSRPPPRAVAETNPFTDKGH